MNEDWISTAASLPNEGVHVAVWTSLEQWSAGLEQVWIGMYDDCDKQWFLFGPRGMERAEVTHWARLPAPPVRS